MICYIPRTPIGCGPPHDEGAYRLLLLLIALLCLIQFCGSI